MLRFTIFLLTLILISNFTGCTTKGNGQFEAKVSSENVNKLQVVDCLLPGQVRKLGSNLTYLTARRPVRITAANCEIRGGEYVAFDRANYATALEIWLPKANEGDPEAQTYVGEIYEKGLGRSPDYQMAAVWYQKAAEQNFSPAQLNLGYLYEKGHGVKQDMVAALNWYRKASGLENTDLTFAASLEIDSSQLKALDGQQTAKAQAEPAEIQLELINLKEKLKASENQLKVTHQQLEKYKSELIEERKVTERLRNELQQKKDQIIHENNKDASLKFIEEIAAFENKLKQKETELITKQKTIVKLERQAQEQEQLLGNLKQEQSSRSKTNHEKELEIKAREKQILALQNRIEYLEKEKTEVNDKNSAKKTTELPGPRIQIIEPPLIVQRGTLAIRTRSDLDKRTIVGKVIAPAGFFSLFVNEEEKKVDQNGTFKVDVPLKSLSMPIQIVAIDKNSKRSELQFTIEKPLETKDVVSTHQKDSGISSSKDNLLDLLPRSIFGKYYALVIGNNNYTDIEKLKTAINDANKISEVLKNKYGFETQVLLDATRFDILNALNEYRKVLTKNDNLLIYYAGHGKLEEVNNRGYWLPVDAEYDSSANWLSLQNITDQLRIIESKQILVVADSCYSGSLTRSSIARLEAGMTLEKRAEWIKQLLNTKSRVALTSGGLKPVLDGGGGNHSIFAKAFIETLLTNNGLMESQALYRNVSALVADAAQEFGFDQVPEYAPIHHSGHSAGEFFFYPK